MKNEIYKCFFLGIFYLLFGLSTTSGQPQYDVRLVHATTNCQTEEIFVDVQIKASTPSSQFNLGIQNYRTNFNTTTVPPISPPIGSGNPPDRSVYISQELTISGVVAGSSYSPHHLTGSSGNLISHNVNHVGGPGYPLTFDTWTAVARLRMNLTDPMPPCLNLTWNVNTLILTGNFQVASPGSLNNLTICGICQLLPIELARFEVTENNCRALLEWETLSETNSNHFLIEKSTDGDSFEVIGQVEAAGTSTSRIPYHFEDEIINPENYYRLKQVDFDGNFSISEIRFAGSSCFQETQEPGFISIYPNPVRTSGKVKFQVNASREENGILEISNVNGLVVKRKEYNLTKGPNLLLANTPGLEAGIYFLKFVSPSSEVGTGKLVVAE